MISNIVSACLLPPGANLAVALLELGEDYIKPKLASLPSYASQGSLLQELIKKLHKPA